MVVQTNYSLNHAEAYAGMVADLELTNTISKINKTVAVLPYGKGLVADGENAAQLPNPASVSADVVGVLRYELNRAQQDGDVAGGTPNQLMSVVTQGTIWVAAAETVAFGDPVFLRVGATNNGDFANDAGAGATLSVALAGAKFLTGGNAGDLVKIALSGNFGG